MSGKRWVACGQPVVRQQDDRANGGHDQVGDDGPEHRRWRIAGLPDADVQPRRRLLARAAGSTAAGHRSSVVLLVSVIGQERQHRAPRQGLRGVAGEHRHDGATNRSSSSSRSQAPTRRAQQVASLIHVDDRDAATAELGCRLVRGPAARSGSATVVARPAVRGGAPPPRRPASARLAARPVSRSARSNAQGRPTYISSQPTLRARPSSDDRGADRATMRRRGTAIAVADPCRGHALGTQQPAVTVDQHDVRTRARRRSSGTAPADQRGIEHEQGACRVGTRRAAGPARGWPPSRHPPWAATTTTVSPRRWGLGADRLDLDLRATAPRRRRARRQQRVRGPRPGPRSLRAVASRLRRSQSSGTVKRGRWDPGARSTRAGDAGARRR